MQITRITTRPYLVAMFLVLTTLLEISYLLIFDYVIKPIDPNTLLEKENKYIWVY